MSDSNYTATAKHISVEKYENSLQVSAHPTAIGVELY